MAHERAPESPFLGPRIWTHHSLDAADPGAVRLHSDSGNENRCSAVECTAAVAVLGGAVGAGSAAKLHETVYLVSSCRLTVWTEWVGQVLYALPVVAGCNLAESAAVAGDDGILDSARRTAATIDWLG
jgi:hypothetical protein